MFSHVTTLTFTLLGIINNNNLKISSSKLAGILMILSLVSCLHSEHPGFPKKLKRGLDRDLSLQRKMYAKISEFLLHF